MISVAVLFLVGCGSKGNTFKVDDGGNLTEKDISLGRTCSKKTECDDGHACTTDDCAGGDFEDGPANEARFSYPVGVAVGGDGKVYITDQSNYRIRVYIP